MDCVIDLILWGAGGHGQVALDTALATGLFHSIGFIDDEKQVSCLFGYPGVGSRICLPDWRGYCVLVSIGQNLSRANCFELALLNGLVPTTLVHPSAIVSPRAEVGAGTLILPKAVINAGASIGRNCIVNTGAIVEHDCVICDHAHLAPGATLGASVKIGEGALLGIGAIALGGVSIGARAVIGAGAVVLNDVLPGTTAVGIPARAVGSAQHKSRLGGEAIQANAVGM
jgi:sugar O-acyltransferase (sialic acid O-acetyltransferase NeuD family)